MTATELMQLMMCVAAGVAIGELIATLIDEYFDDKDGKWRR